MKIAPIPPTALLEQYSTDYHLCLAHVLGNNPRQMEYYQQRTSMGEYVILDNGAYELGSSVPFEHVLEVAEQIKPNEIVLPDVFLDSAATIKATEAAWEALHSFSQDEYTYTNLMAVPQGKNSDEWIACLKILVKMVTPDAIGIPIVYERMMGRGVLLLKTIEFLHNHPTCHPDIHLLGWDGDLYKLNAYARQFPLWIRGIDSAKPFYYADVLDPKTIISGEQLKRPEDYFELSPEDLDPQVIKYNINSMDTAARGDLAKLFL
jgi:hypothetical protein